MLNRLFGGGEDDSTDESLGGEAEESASVPTTITNEPYGFTQTGAEYAADGMTETITETEEQGPVAGPEIRELLERARDHPDMPLWLGYNDSAQQGFDPAPVEFNQLFQHLWVVGTTGAGKTTEMLNWMVQLAWAGYGFIYFDPKAEDSKELLQKLPEYRHDDVIWIEPGDDDHDRSIGINFLEVPDCESEMELEQHVTDRIQVLKAVLSGDDYWGPRMNAIVESMARAMMQANHEIEDRDEQYCVLDMYFVLLNAQRREDFADEIDDPWVGEFVSEIAEMDDDAVRPVITRLKPWVESPVTRRIAGCRASTIDFRDILDDEKIVIVRTAVSDDDIKQLVTLGTLRPLWNAIQNRSIEGAEKTPFFAILDEADRVLHKNLDVDDMLARARSMRLSVTLACQYPTQLKESGVLKPVKNNCNTGVFFRVLDDEDARPLTRRLSDCDIEDFTELENHRIWSRIPLDGGTRFSGALKLKTFAPYPNIRDEDEAEEIITESLGRFAVPPLTDDEMMRQLKFGGMNETVTPEKASAKTLDTATDERSRDAALKAIYDESIRQGQPGEFVPIDACLDRLNRYLPARGGVETAERAWRHVLKDIPEAYLDYREENEQGQVKVRSRSFMNIGDRENDGGAEHWAPMADAYVPLTQLGFVVDILAQDGGDMPDALASVEDALDIPDDADNEEIADAVAHYREQNPVMNRLAGAREVYIESEHTTGNSQPSQTVRNVMQAVNEGKRCLLISREQTARRVHTTLLTEPKGCHKNHSVDGEQRFYTLTGDVAIDGEVITRPGSSDNVWVYEESSGEYVLRDDNGTEHARFENAEAIFEDATAYPMGGDRSIKAPIIPDYDTDMLDFIVVKEDAKTPADLFLYRPDGDHVPLDMLATDDGEATQTVADDDHSHAETESEDDGGDIVDALR
ncbi:TraM recognition domain-containing protein [Haladaptatus sp. DYF46]|uniref:type IV secretory system conjugative DNA transfer family protein n=1 Tax=Haladaptatus sp. DYF46 TaxID=2886041 RepID=UPI001E657407|nr:TraM recognition domain-containing protein [Haladaptatus sp. DYF46]